MPTDFLVLGATGYFGEHIVKWLKTKGKSFEVSSVRIHNREQVDAVLEKVQPKRVICCAGIAGRPNIDWCETNRQETIRVNVLGAMNVVDLCYLRNIHVTYFGTGCLYKYDEKHPLNSGIGYKEEEQPNFTGNFYTRMRILLEQLMNEYSNALTLRVLFPITDDFHERSVPAKLTKYAKIFSVPNSFTIIDDLWPLAIEMSERNITGTYNFANPGVISHDELLGLYKKYIDPNFTWCSASVEEQLNYMKAGRPNCELDVSKLLQLFPDVPNVKDSLDNLFQRMKKNLNK